MGDLAQITVPKIGFFVGTHIAIDCMNLSSRKSPSMLTLIYEDPAGAKNIPNPLKHQKVIQMGRCFQTNIS